MLGPLPSSLAPPSIWFDAVLAPNRKPGGSRGRDTGIIVSVTVIVRRGMDRFLTREPGRQTRHSFSFGSSYDPAHLAFGADADDLGVAGATYRIAALDAGATVTVPPAARRHLFVATGALVRSSLAEPLSAGDAFEVTGEHDLTVTAGVPTQLLVWSFDA